MPQPYDLDDPYDQFLFAVAIRQLAHATIDTSGKWLQRSSSTSAGLPEATTVGFALQLRQKSVVGVGTAEYPGQLITPFGTLQLFTEMSPNTPAAVVAEVKAFVGRFVLRRAVTRGQFITCAVEGFDHFTFPPAAWKDVSSGRWSEWYALQRRLDGEGGDAFSVLLSRQGRDPLSVGGGGAVRDHTEARRQYHELREAAIAIQSQLAQIPGYEGFLIGPPPGLRPDQTEDRHIVFLVSPHGNLDALRAAIAGIPGAHARRSGSLESGGGMTLGPSTAPVPDAPAGRAARDDNAVTRARFWNAVGSILPTDSAPLVAAVRKIAVPGQAIAYGVDARAILERVERQLPPPSPRLVHRATRDIRQAQDALLEKLEASASNPELWRVVLTAGMAVESQLGRLVVAAGAQAECARMDRLRAAASAAGLAPPNTTHQAQL